MWDEPLVVQGDSVRLIQAVANLLNNAARYTDPAGTIRVSCKVSDGNAELRIVDDGRGIAPEFLPRIFQMFVQERNSAAGGLGLGLSLASRLIEMHGGSIQAFSEGQGKGSEFVVRIPLADDADSVRPVPSTRPPVARSSRRLRVALIDDNPDVRELMRELISMWGHEIRTAESGEAGIALILDQRPDVAFVDIGLPDIPGYEVASRVRRELGQNAVRLIAMTGFGRDTDRSRAHEAGFDLHLTKPADIETLKKALEFEET
jgi:signal transduction histidine kinase